MRRALAFGTLALVVAVAIGLVAGPHGLSLPNAESAVLRLHRTLLAGAVGAALASTGAALQALLRNVLAEPFVIGVSGGAAVGGALPLVVAGSAFAALTVPLGAVLGAVAASLLLTAFLARDKRPHSHATLLVGVAMNAFASALITVLKTLLPPDRTSSLLFWLTGSIGYVDGPTLALVVVCVCVSMAVLIRRAGELELLALGDDEALRLGVDTTRTRIVAYLACSLAVGAVVPVSGLIGFVGVVVPHALRLAVSADMRFLLPMSAIVGAAGLVVTDALSRLSFALFSTEIPVGALTAALGAPFFAFALMRDLKRGGDT
jgi:iron complex transport system permease protein